LKTAINTKVPTCDDKWDLWWQMRLHRW
jgi:hypothetical protein